MYVCYIETLPLIMCFPPLSLNRIKIKHALVFKKKKISFNWGIYSVSIEISKHFTLVILVGPSSTLSAYTQAALLRRQWSFLCGQIFRWPESYN